ncbi:MAG: nucleotidyltransferase domain-containing protein [bacterium]
MNDLWLFKFQQEALPEIVREFNPKRIIVFGSRAQGKAHQESDLDVILISSYFQDIPFLKRMAMVLKKVRFPKHIDYLCYTEEEFEKLKHTSSILSDAMENYIELAA